MVHTICISDATITQQADAAAVLGYPYMGQTRFEIMAYQNCVAKYAGLFLPFSAQNPGVRITVSHNGGTTLSVQSGNILSVQNLFPSLPLTPASDRYLSRKLTQYLFQHQNKKTTDQQVTRLATLWYCRYVLCPVHPDSITAAITASERSSL